MNQTNKFKEQLIKSLKKRKINLSESVTFVDGFINVSIEQNTERNILNPAYLPMILLVGNETNEAYFFAVKALLPLDGAS